MNLDRFNELLKKQIFFDNNSVSFLEVIEKQYDENIISKYLLYIVIHNIELLNLVLRKCYKDCYVNIDHIYFSATEFVINESKRIDILIEGVDINNSKVLIVIENKINSFEHGDQCNVYFEYCKKRYKDYKQYYLFLYPDYNLLIKNISNSNFKKITYTNLLELFDLLENKTLFEKDFCKLIYNQLRSKPMDELKLFLINHYSQIKDNINSIDKTLDNIFNEFREYFIKLNPEFTYEFSDSRRTLRFYKKDNAKWRNGWEVSNDERIYFYIEIKCEDNLDFYIQRTLKVYSKNLNSKINRYVLSPNIKLVQHRYMDTFKVFERIKLDSKFQILSYSWKQDLFIKAENLLKELSIHQQEEVDKYFNYNIVKI